MVIPGPVALPIAGESHRLGKAGLRGALLADGARGSRDEIDDRQLRLFSCDQECGLEFQVPRDVESFPVEFTVAVPRSAGMIATPNFSSKLSDCTNDTVAVPGGLDRVQG